MSTLSSYENYTTENGSEYTAEEKAKFVATGVLPVSGKYHTDDAKPKTKSVKLSDLIGGGSELPSHSNDDQGKVLTVVGSNGDDIGWRTPAGGSSLPSTQSIIGVTYREDISSAPYTNIPIELRCVANITTDENCVITQVSAAKWQYDPSDGSGEWTDL